MMKSKCPKWVIPTALGVMISVFLLSPMPEAMAQDQADPAKASAKISNSTAQPAAGKVGRSGRPGFEGPVQPAARSRQSVKSRKRSPTAGKRKSAGIPKPTVVLKPGEVPAIKFDTPDYDFGRVRSGPDITHDFWFTNTGTGPLEILKVRPG